MSVRALAVSLLAFFPLACGGMHGGANGPTGTVARVLDGDTIVLTDGRHLRLVQLDAPETDENECYAQPAKAFLENLLPAGTHVAIELDPALDHVDRFGRTLAYVEKNGTNINIQLVREGAAAPWFFHGGPGPLRLHLPVGSPRSEETPARALGRLPAHQARPAPPRRGTKLAICKSRPIERTRREENNLPWPKRR